MLDHGKFILGPEIQELETKLAGFTGTSHCISCSSGTNALLLALMAYGIGPGNAVFTTPFTFIATATIDTLRSKLIKIGARVKQSCRKVCIYFASGYPYQDFYATVLYRIHLAPQ